MDQFKKVLTILDRDGTIIKNDDFFGKEKNWQDKIEFNLDLIKLLHTLDSNCINTKIIVTNQSGVARGFFDCKTIDKINDYIHFYLFKEGIRIDDWQYCPFVDRAFTLKFPEISFDQRYVSDKTKRKPNLDMVLDSLRKLNRSLDDFDYKIVIGNSKGDEKLAQNLGAFFLDVTYKNYQSLCDDLSSSLPLNLK